MEQTQYANALLQSIREISHAYDLENINRQLSVMAEEQILMGAELHVLAAHFEPERLRNDVEIFEAEHSIERLPIRSTPYGTRKPFDKLQSETDNLNCSICGTLLDRSKDRCPKCLAIIY